MTGILAPAEAENQPVVLQVGESNFTLTMALAGLRQSSEKIVSTCFGEFSEDDQPRPTLETLKQRNVDFSQENCRLLNAEPDDYTPRLELIRELPAIHSGINATDCQLFASNIAWFQCPWSTNDRNQTGNLIAEFLNNMALKQSNGSYVLIGIANQFPYTKSYKLQDWLFDRQIEVNESLARYYVLKGADTQLISTLLKYGYRHKTPTRDIHSNIITDHITLVFQRNATAFTDDERIETNTV